MRFAHLADCHLGYSRQPELQELSVRAFQMAVDECIREKVNFVLITGDLFDTAMPSIEVLKEAAAKLKELRENNIDCYVIAGSHDFSVSGKTFLDVLENAGLFVNVARYQETENDVKLEVFRKNGVILCGVPGKKAGLETKIINKIRHENIDGELKILALHTTLTEAKPKDMKFVESVDASALPKGFDYYALGHLHEYFNKNIGGKICVYPGPLLPTSFNEFEEIGHGSFCMVSWNNGITIEKKDIVLKEVENIGINAENKSPEQVTDEILEKINCCGDKIIALRVGGTLSRGRTSDIDFNRINDAVAKKNNILLKSASALKSPEFGGEIDSDGKDVDEIEKEVIEKNGKKEEFKEFSGIIESLIHALDIEKHEGETSIVFEKRIMEEANKVLGI